MKKTPLYDLHIEAGARMGEFAGFDMPLFYPLGVMKEHLHTRAHAGLFDISHMAHLEIAGPSAAALVSKLCPYEAAAQEIGQARYTFLLNEDAGIIDDLIVTRLAETRYLIVANAGCAGKDIAHIEHASREFDVRIVLIPRGFLALQGPDAENVLTDTGFDVADMSFMTAREPETSWFISRTGYTGEDGFEIAMPESKAAAFARQLLADERVEWVGLGARDSLRLEAGLPLYGQDLAEDITPHEAGLLWAIPKNLREDGAFIGAAALAKKIVEGRKRMRVGLVPDGRPVRGGAELQDANGKRIGIVTSGGFGPTADGPIALGMVDVDAADEQVFAGVRGRQVAMERAKLPFVAHNYKR